VTNVITERMKEMPIERTAMGPEKWDFELKNGRTTRAKIQNEANGIKNIAQTNCSVIII
tara:strand:- start:523 stop:699 length:177 start_codon:yes stop_codon:yes gene_type:complete